MSSQMVSSDNTVVIQINPQVVQGDVKEQEKKGQYPNELLKGFLKGQPKTLGTVQIMNGVIMFLFGIVLFIRYPYFSLTVGSCITFWGSLIYISAGSLSVAGESKLYPCVVKASLGMNVLGAMVTGAAIFLMSSDLAIGLHQWSDITVFLVFTILQFFISICILIVVCNATFDTSMVNLPLNQSSVKDEETSNLNRGENSRM